MGGRRSSGDYGRAAGNAIYICPTLGVQLRQTEDALRVEREPM